MIVCLSPNGQNRTRGDGPCDTLYVATIRGLHVLVRAGGGWREDYASLENKHISSLLYEPASQLLFAGIHGRGELGGLFFSRDHGHTWAPRMAGLDRPHVYTLTAETRGDQVILYAGTESPALYRSDDLGETWRDLDSLRAVPGTEKWIFPPPPHIAHVKNVAFHPARPGQLYVCVEQGAVLKTIDDGVSWRELDAYASEHDEFYHDVHRIAIGQDNPDRIHLTTGDGLYFSEDAGESWVHQQGRADRVGYPDALFLHPGDDATVYMGGAGDAPESWRVNNSAQAGFIVSHDSGATWAELMHGMPADFRGNLEAMSMHASPGGTAFYAGTAVGDVFASEDAGLNWTVIATGLPPVSKSRHYRHFLSADEKRAIEDQAKAERRAEQLPERAYVTNA